MGQVAAPRVHRLSTPYRMASIGNCRLLDIRIDTIRPFIYSRSSKAPSYQSVIYLFPVNAGFDAWFGSKAPNLGLAIDG